MVLHSLFRLVCAGWACATLAAAFSAGAAAQEPSNVRDFVAPRPEWVDYIETPIARPERMNAVDQGVYYLAIDVQVRRQGDETWFYRRTVRQVTSRAGLEAVAALSYSFDPELDSFAFHAVTVERDGELLDRLPALDIETARQEPRLDAGIIDGEITVFSEINDVRVGDIIDVETSWRQRDVLWSDGFAASAGFEWSVPVGVSRLRLLTPADLDLAVRNHGVEMEPTVTTRGDEVERIWLAVDADPILGEDFTPATYPTWGYIETSTMRSWSEVADWAVDVFDIDRTLPPLIEAEVNRIAGETDDPALRATLALRHVQATIRYVGDEVGLGSHVPRSPTEVAERGWGDCKDVSLLLATMLNAMGIEAYPALTDIDGGPGLPDGLPSPYAFDHAITLAILGGEHYWLDATRTHQGGVLPALAQPDFAYALPIRAGQNDLAPIELPEPDAPEIETVEAFDLQRGEGVMLVVSTRYVGREADQFRFRLDSEGRDAVLQTFLEYYQQLYPGLERNGDATIEDRFDDNIIDLTERYRLSAERYVADGLNQNFPMRADVVLGLIPAVTAPARETPMALPYPLHRRHVIELRNAPTVLLTSEPLAFENAHVRFSTSQRELPQGLRAEFSLQTMTAVVSPGDAATVSQISSEIADNSDLVINLEPPPGAVGWLAQTTANLTEAQIEMAGVVVVFAFFSVIIVVGAWWSLLADRALPPERVFHPVGLFKFLLLSIATYGTYSAFWMWRCWRWVKRNEPRPMWPFARAFFSGIFFIPLFDEIRRRANGADYLTALGVLLWIVYIGGRIASRVTETTYPALSVGLDLLGILATLPLVWGVNRLNRAQPQVIARTSRWGVRAFGALTAGLLFWTLVYFGLTAPTASAAVDLPSP